MENLKSGFDKAKRNFDYQEFVEFQDLDSKTNDEILAMIEFYDDVELDKESRLCKEYLHLNRKVDWRKFEPAQLLKGETEREKQARTYRLEKQRQERKRLRAIAQEKIRLEKIVPKGKVTERKRNELINALAQEDTEDRDIQSLARQVLGKDWKTVLESHKREQEYQTIKAKEKERIRQKELREKVQWELDEPKRIEQLERDRENKERLAKIPRYQHNDLISRVKRELEYQYIPKEWRM